MAKKSSGLMLWLGVATVAVLLDQLSKITMSRLLSYGQSETITSYFNLVMVYNQGAAFSFLSNQGGWQRWFFTAIGIAAAVFIVWMLRSHPGQKLFAFALSCILGGAVGNVIDRLIHGYVVDWLDFHFDFLSPLFRGGHFPSFNIADVAITIGAIALILDEILRVRRGR